LLPGGLSLRHGFPKWFEKSDKVPSPMFRDIGAKEVNSPRSGSPEKRLGHRRPLSFHIPPPKEDGYSTDDVPSTIIEVLHYLKRAFEDETILDDLPMEAAANLGAWHAWRAHRRKAKLQKSHADKLEGHRRSMSANIPSPTTPNRPKSSGDWNWDGVWVERVKKGISTSLSEHMLYGSVDGDDLVSCSISRFWYKLINFLKRYTF
jgi:hypothetical protein